MRNPASSRTIIALSAVLLLAACAPRSAPPRAPSVGFPPVAVRISELVNAERARGATCGGERFRPARPVTLEARLVRAAQKHSADQAARRVMGHVGGDGSRIGERVTREGYPWSYVAENVAWNQPTPEVVVAAWMKSPPHCSAIMTAEVEQMGAAEVDLFWTLVFARPR